LISTAVRPGYAKYATKLAAVAAQTRAPGRIAAVNTGAVTAVFAFFSIIVLLSLVLL
jgi:hypothetical protein